MAECTGVCRQEQAGLASFSSPYIADDEWVCRTVRPAEFKTKKTLKASFIQTSRLRAGELSAWRLATPDELERLAEKLRANGDPPDNILAARAGDLRKIAIQDRIRCLSVVNDTRIDDQGGHDLQHVTLAPCALLMAESDPDVVTTELKAQLLLVYRSKNATALHDVPDK